MATVSQGYYGGTMEGSASSSSSSADSQINDRFKQLYPFVNEDETPLPRSWSFREKYSYIGLSQNNLRAHYKDPSKVHTENGIFSSRTGGIGQGKTHKDAASVRTSHPIPAACGLYYFEIKIVSKGRDGYMGIGLAAHGVSMNRLPGWDKHSYGYHGDDGHSFCSSGTGQPYGPTFTTGDVIGCGVNMVDNTCFYTKNGHNLGIAFTDLPPNLYPTVGLQTPGEIVEANFGQAPFVFDIEDMMKELRVRTRAVIEKYPIADKQGMWQTSLHRIVQTYLVHHGYRTTAEVFARCTGQSFEEDITSIKKRQRVQRLVLTGRIGEAIETTQKLYPGLLERNANLLFMLKCRQFIEMVNGTDSEVRPSRSPKSQGSSPSMSPNYPTQQQQQHPQHRTIHSSSNLVTFCGSPARGCSSPQIITPKPVPPPPLSSPLDSSSNNNVHSLPSIEDMNDVNSAMNGEVLNGNTESYKTDGMQQQDGDIDMENMESSAGFDMNDGGVVRTAGGGSLVTNGAHVSLTTGDGYQNGNCHSIDDDGYDNDMDVDPPSTRRQLCGGSQAAVERMLLFGRELHAMSVQLKREYGTNEVNKKMLQDAFSLLAYADPWSSPVGGQLDPVQREPVCAALNSAILESQNMARRPPLEMVISHSRELLKLMARAGLGSCAFADIDSLLK